MTSATASDKVEQSVAVEDDASDIIAADEETRLETPPKPQHSRFLLKSATNLGISEEVAASMTTRELNEAVYEATVQLKAISENNRRAESRNTDTPTRAVEAVEEEDEYDLGELESTMDPKAVRAIKAGKATKAQVKELQAKLAAQEEREQRRESQAIADKLDTAFAALGDDFTELLGVDSAADLQDKKQMKRRIAVLNASGIDFSKPLPGTATLKAKLKATAADLFGLAEPAPKKAAPPVKKSPYAEVLDDDDDAPAPKKPASKAKYTEEEWEEGGIPRPTQRAAKEVKGVEHAKQKHRERMREQRADEDDDDLL